MKELSIEDKAYNGNYKAYTELINRLEEVKEAIKKQNYGIAMDILCKPYPKFQVTTSTELKESEDERIKKRILFSLQKDIMATKNSGCNTKDLEECIDWLKSLKDRVQLQPKQEWSEEDKIALGDALWCCKQAASIAKDENDMGNVWYAERWLKSLKERYTWKPSDEQMKALEDSIEFLGCTKKVRDDLK